MKSIEASLKSTRGAGGAAISAFMRIRGVVFVNSPAFALVDSNTLSKVSAIEAFGPFLRGIVQKLDALFNEGKASPTDIDDYGNTLLHVSR